MMRKTIMLILVIVSLTALCSCDIIDNLINQNNTDDPVNGGNNLNPTVIFSQPTNGISVGKDIGVVVNASDSDGTIIKVDLYINNKFVRTDNSTPYEWGTSCSASDNDLMNLSNGSYTLKAIAIDNEGGSSTQKITVKVDYSNNNVPHTFTISGVDHAWDAYTPFEACSSCHGSDLKGGTSGVSCFSCHGDLWTDLGG